jgi:DNA polymerase III subunit epsilon
VGKFYDPRTVVNEAYSLDRLCEKYQIELDDRHTAPGDAFLTAQLLLKLLKLAEKKGIKTFGELIG